MNLSSDWSLKVKHDFGRTIEPFKGESWEKCYDRLDKTIFQAKEHKLISAIQLGCDKAVIRLLKEGCDINQNILILPIDLAAICVHKHPEKESTQRTLKVILCSSDLDPKAKVIHSIIKSTNEKVTQLFLKHRPDLLQLKYNGKNILHTVIGEPRAFSDELNPMATNQNILKLLLSSLPEFINEKEDRVGATPLHFAAGKLDHNACRHLIKYGANISAKDNFNLLPLDWQKAEKNPHSEKAYQKEKQIIHPLKTLACGIRGFIFISKTKPI